MVEENAAADLGRRIDIDAEYRRRAALQVEREILPAALPQEVRQAVGLQRVEALEIEHGLDRARAGRIAIDHRADIGADRLAGRGLGLDQLVIGLANHIAGHVGMVETGRDAVRDRALERIVVEDGARR